MVKMMKMMQTMTMTTIDDGESKIMATKIKMTMSEIMTY